MVYFLEYEYGIHIQENNNNKMQFDPSLVAWQLLL